MKAVFNPSLCASKDKHRSGIYQRVLGDYTDQTKPVAIATNGKAMAIVPIEMCDTDKVLNGNFQLPMTIVEDAHKKKTYAGKIIVNISEELCSPETMIGKATLSDDSSHPYKYDTAVPFLRWRTVIPPDDTKHVEFTVNAKLLLLAAKAIGAEESVTVRLHVNTLGEVLHDLPLKLTGDHDGAFAILILNRKY